MAAAGVIDAFTLPAHLEAAEPPEARGLERDDVRLLVSNIATDAIHHSRFSKLPRWLSPGDLLVVNTSGTLKAALDARTESGDAVEVHLSTHMPGNFWVVEVRRHGPTGTSADHDVRAGSRLELDHGGGINLLAPYPFASLARRSRLWLAALQLSEPVLAYLERFGKPIRYKYVPASWPSSHVPDRFRHRAWQRRDALRRTTVYPHARNAPHRSRSADRTVAAPTGVASLEQHEPPYEE